MEIRFFLEAPGRRSQRRSMESPPGPLGLYPPRRGSTSPGRTPKEVRFPNPESQAWKDLWDLEELVISKEGDDYLVSARRRGATSRAKVKGDVFQRWEAPYLYSLGASEDFVPWEPAWMNWWAHSAFFLLLLAAATFLGVGPSSPTLQLSWTSSRKLLEESGRETPPMPRRLKGSVAGKGPPDLAFHAPRDGPRI